MNLFEKLSDPVYFSKFSSRLTIGVSFIAFFLFGYLFYISIQNGPSIAGFVSALIILMGIKNFVKATKTLKKLRGIKPKYRNAKRTPNP
jgi:hypothetical protein